MDYMDLVIRCPRKAVKLNHSLTHWILILWCVMHDHSVHVSIYELQGGEHDGNTSFLCVPSYIGLMWAVTNFLN